MSGTLHEPAAAPAVGKSQGAVTSALGARWLLPDAPPEQAEVLAAELKVPLFFATLLYRAGISTAAEAHAYLAPSLSNLHDPFLFCGMRPAVHRLLAAIRSREAILIYGDYDVDGTLATVLLKTAVDRLTPKGEPSLVRYHIPHRIREGYGLHGSVLADAYSSGVRLAISVDTGIRAFAAADEARRLGLDLIVTDHHLPEQMGVPDADAVINPNQEGCDYPFKDLCGAAVAYKLAEALLRSAAGEPGDGLQPVSAEALGKLLPSLLKLVAVATVADAVPLRGENRAIVAIGLAELRDPRQPGLRALMRLAEAGGDGRPPSATEVGFRIGPRINAAGRMDIASDVVQLLLTKDAQEGETLARKLHGLNDERRAVEQAVLQNIEAELLARASVTDDRRQTTPVDCLVIDGEGWHRGVIGILASRVVERTNLPALVISHEAGQAHGSGRSIAGFHLLDAITAAHEAHLKSYGAALFDRFGGHAHAVGFSLPSAHVSTLRAFLTQYAAAKIEPAMLEQSLTIAAELQLNQITAETIQQVRRMEPFGNGNPEPVFAMRALRVAEVRPLKERHIKLHLQRDGQTIPCLAWARAFSWPERLAELGIGPGSIVDVAFQLRENRHPDFGGPELQMCDIRRHTDSAGAREILQPSGEDRVLYTDSTLTAWTK